MTSCPECGNQLPDDAKECPHCRAAAANPEAPPPEKKVPWLFIVLGIGLALGLVFFLTVVWPAFNTFQAKGWQSEPYVNLRVVFLTEDGYFGEHNTYAATFVQMDWKPSGETRYAYFLPGQVIQPTIGGPYQLPPGAPQPEVSDTGYTVVAVGDIDGDGEMDVWTMNNSHHLENVINDIGGGGSPQGAPPVPAPPPQPALPPPPP